ncbi:hypothetical protein MTR67_039342 [Solanum verrucosum]|uniref:Late blight resistance protein n=1 Tax=Solanum verrucosum TaxID=315347 RepID=A0AAF0UH83_SOLVR|nr:hypothetical protein MTR67_039342 [Solanum verrucosum]
MQILRSCRCNPRLPSTESRSDHNLAGGPWFTTATPPQTQLKKLARSRPMDRPTVRRSDHGPWSMSVNQDSFTETLTRTTVDQHGPSFNAWSVGLTVDEGQQPVRGKLLIG